MDNLFPAPEVRTKQLLLIARIAHSGF